MQNFPKIFINNIENLTGFYNKSLTLHKSFLSMENNSVFVTKNEKKLSIVLLKMEKLNRLVFVRNYIPWLKL